MFVNNFGKCDRFPKFFHQLIHKKILYVYTTDFHLTCNTLWMSKIQKMLQILTAPQQTVDKFLRTLWTLDLTFNSSWTNCPETADTEWLPNILKYVRRRLESTVEHCSVERCCITVIFHRDYLRTVFILSRLCTSYVVHIF